MGANPVIIEGVPVGVPFVIGIYANPVVAVVDGAGEPTVDTVIKLKLPEPFVVNT